MSESTTVRPETVPVEARGRRIHVLRHGHGPIGVLLVHGWGSNPWVWEQYLRSLDPTTHTGVAVDFFGESDAPWDGYNVSSFADELRDVIEALGIGGVIYVGHSLGGIIGQLFALRYPELLRGLVLVGTGPTTQAHGTLLKLYERLRDCGGDVQVLGELVASSYGALPQPDVFGFYVDRLRIANYPGLVEAMGSGLTYDFVERLPFIATPSLVVHGVHEVGRTEVHVDLFRRGLPDTRIQYLDCGHYPMEELPEEFNRAVNDFIAEVAG